VVTTAVPVLDERQVGRVPLDARQLSDRGTGSGISFPRVAEGVMIEAHLRKLRARTDITSADEATIREMISDIRRIPAHSLIARGGELREHSLLIIDGWIARSKDLPEGRVVAGLCLPGDYADLHGLTLRRIDHDLLALTDCKVAIVQHSDLCKLFERCPKVAWLYWFGTNADAAMHREWAASFGKRSTLRRIAHLFCEIYLRLDVVGLTYGSSCEFPLTQNQLAECVGATPVHVNRVLQELRNAGLILLERRQLTIIDAPALRRAGGFDAAYLYADAPVSAHLSAMAAAGEAFAHGPERAFEHPC
jgi:CRP-like cAMP-binding protein